MKKIKSCLVFSVLIPLLWVVITEVIQRGSLVSVVNWLYLYPAEFFISYLFVFALLLLSLALINHLRGAFFTVLTISLLFALISNIKQRFLGEPLLPWDFVLGRETTDIIVYFTSFINLKNIFLLALLIILVVVLFRYLPFPQESNKYRKRERVAFLLIAVVLISSVYIGKPVSFKKIFDLQCVTWDQKLNSTRNGLLLSFLTNLQWLSVEEPAAYSEGKIKDIIKEYTECSAVVPISSGGATSQEQPDIIVIMSEAFWDPCLLPGVTFNQDPLPFFRALQKTHTTGSLLVPVFGGGTVNTEFEVLTGHSMRFLPGGSIAYAQYVRKPLESLASILASQGYQTTAIHSYHNWFYRRNQVFHNLGFSKFISSEFFIEPELKRYYISDREVSDLIIDEVEKSTEPSFIFAVTMQNHGPYLLGYGEEAKIKVEGDITPEAQNLLEIYAQGIADADQALAMLVKHFQKSERPTILVFFGDHLPSLGEDYQVYRETGFYQEDYSYAEYQKMYSVPVLLWSNYLSPGGKLNFNSSYLGPYILQKAGLRGTLYTDYLLALSQKMPLISMRTYDSVLGIDKSLLEEYHLLQYDLLFGQGYSYQGDSPLICQKDYFLGKGEMLIERGRFLEGTEGKAGETKLEITGKNFTPHGRVYLNDKEMGTTFITENKLTISVPGKLLKQLENTTVQVKVIDSLNISIAESNCTLLGKMLK